MGAALFQLACARNPAEWPPEEIAHFEERCPALFGAARICPCYAREAARQLPYSRAKVYLAAEDPSRGFEDVYEALEAVTRRCAKGLARTAWPAELRRGFDQGCLRKRGATQETCACLAGVLEQALSAEDFVASGLGTRAGKPAAAELTQVFSSADAIACFSVAADAPWPAATYERLVSQCEEKDEVPAELCPCFARRTMASLRRSEWTLLASGRDGGAAVEAKLAAQVPRWLLECGREEKAALRKH